MAKIYISSTYEDLAGAREAVYHALRKMRQDVIAMEDYVASDQRPLDKCLTDVAECDIYVGIFAWRYGYIPPEQEYSITELEFREAVKHEKTCLLFLLHEEAPWPRSQMDADDAQIEALRKELRRDYVVSFFHTVDELAKEVSVAVAEKANIVSPPGVLKVGNQAAPNTPARNDLKEHLAGIELQHGHIRLLGFHSTANVPVRTMDVFVNLLMTSREGPAEGDMTAEQVLPWLEKEKRLLLIRGEPGAGKTTLMQYLALNCVDEAGRKRLRLNRPLIPIFIRLRKVDPSKPFCEMLHTLAESKHYSISSDTFEGWLRDPGALILLDGLDEISDKSKRRKVCRWLENASTNGAFANSRFICTARFSTFEGKDRVEVGSSVLEADIRALSPEQQGIFLRKWFAATYKSAPDAPEPGKIANQVVDFLSREENRSLRELAATPMILQIMAILQKEFRHIGEGRAHLYDRCTAYLLGDRESARDNPPPIHESDSKILLRSLALKMQEVLRTDEISEGDILLFFRKDEPVDAVNPEVEPEAFLDYLRERAGILKRQDGAYYWAHKSFREFFAGEKLAGEVQAQAERVTVLIDSIKDSWWRETILFALSLPNPVILPIFLERFLPHKNHDTETAMFLEQIVMEARQKQIAPFRKFILDGRRKWQLRYNALRSLRLIRSNEAKALLAEVARGGKQNRLREEAREILAQLGERVEPEPQIVRVEEAARSVHRIPKESWRNPFELNAEYIRIEGGEYDYSEQEKNVKIPAIYFAKYPVTNKLYRGFIALLDGKRVPEGALSRDAFVASCLQSMDSVEGLPAFLGKNPDEWDAKLRSRYDNERRFSGEDQPVVGVTWYGAQLYCMWLNAVAAALDDRPGVFSLPHERDWQWAASGGTREYPWGDKAPTDKLANFGNNVGRTAPVGQYPDGATSQGLMDMGGNVWEWQMDWSDKDMDMRVLRGGAFIDFPDGVRCAYRYRGIYDQRRNADILRARSTYPVMLSARRGLGVCAWDDRFSQILPRSLVHYGRATLPRSRCNI